MGHHRLALDSRPALNTWIHDVDRKLFTEHLAQIGGLDPEIVLSSHLPPAPGAMLNTMLDTLT